MIARAIHDLNEVLKTNKIARVATEIDSEWEDGMKSLEISVKYYPLNEEKES